MADTNLSTSISAIRTKILNDTPTATVDELVSLSRAAKSIGLTEDTSIETAINSRANTLSSNANTNDMVKLANTIKQLRNTTAGAVSPSTTSDDIVEGTTNKFMSDTNLQALGSAIIPATDATYDLGSPTNKFRDLYLDTNTLYFGTTQFTADDILNFDLSVQPETLEIQVSTDEAGHGTHWDWTWTQSALPYARTTITETPLSVVPLYMQGTYQINNFANTQYGSMTQTHSFKLKWIEGAGNDNLVSWATTTTVNHSHPDINGGNSTSVERLAVNVPSTITPPTLTAPSVTYTVGSITGAYVFSGTAVGNNPEIGPFYRGGTYTININASGHPFYFTTDNGTNFASNTYFGEYTSGVTGSRTDNGTITFTVPAGAPDVLYYQCGVHGAMRGTIRVKDLAVETNANGNYLIYGQHTQEGHAQTIELRPIPTLTSQMCLVYDSSTNKFVPQDLSTYVENTPAFKNKIKEVAGTATLIAPDGTSLVASVNIYSDATYLPAVGNTVGDIAFVEDTQKLYIYKATGWIETVANADLTGLATEAFVQNYVANLVDSAPTTLDTLNELAAALGDDANFSTTVTNSLANKLEASDLNGYATETYVGDQITAAGSYSDASVDSHLNRSAATTGQILTWNGTDYAWVDASSSISVSETAPSSPSSGDMWFNSADGNTYIWYSDGDSNQWIQINGTGTTVVLGNPTITSVSPNNFDGSSGTVITIQGTNFDVGTVVSFIDANGVETNASATSIVTQGELTATIPQAYTSAEGPLDVKVTVGDGQTITSTDAIQTGGSPIWTTAAGQVGSSLYRDQTGVSLQIEATDPEGQFVSYEVGSGSLAPGLSLAAGTGLITGDITTASITADTNYSFTANANDTVGNSTPRTFFINVLNSGDPIYYTYRVSWGAAASGGDWGHDYGRSPSGSYISGDAYRSDATIAWGGTTDPHSVWGSGSLISLSSLYDTNWGSSGSFDIGVYVHSGSYSGRSTGTNYMDTITFTSRSIDGGVHILQSGDAAKLTNPNENFNALQGDTVYVTVKLP